MLDNWLNPIASDDFPNEARPHTFHDRLYLHRPDDFPSLSRVKACIVGMGSAECRPVRKALFPLAYPFKRFGMADLGNLKRKHVAFGLSLFRELIDNSIVPIVLAPDPSYIESLYTAIQDSRRMPSTLLVHERPLLEPGQAMHGLLKRHPFHLGFIGCQAHFMSPSETKKLEKMQADVVRLGNARSNPIELEPIIRDADLVAIHMGSLKSAEAPAVPRPSPSGFTVEEICQIGRYAGFSDKLKALVICGFKQDQSVDARTAQAMAQLIWYTSEGLYLRKKDYPVSIEGMTEYIVDLADLHQPITFWKSNKSGRWWMQIAIDHEQGPESRHRLVPCSYQDYVQAGEGKLPERLWNALQRLS